MIKTLVVLLLLLQNARNSKDCQDIVSSIVNTLKLRFVVRSVTTALPCRRSGDISLLFHYCITLFVLQITIFSVGIRFPCRGQSFPMKREF